MKTKEKLIESKNTFGYTTVGSNDNQKYFLVFYNSHNNNIDFIG